MKLTYSDELKKLLQDQPSPWMRYGITIIFFICVSLISITPYIASRETYAAKIELNRSGNALAGNRFSANPADSTIISATIHLTIKTVDKLKSNQKVIFPSLNAEGYIYSLKDTAFTNSDFNINITIKPLDAQGYKKLKETSGYIAVRIVQDEMSLFNRLFNYTFRPLRG